LRGVLPFELLVGVREKVGGEGLTVGEKLRAGGGFDERADVRDDGGVAVIEEGLDIGQVWIEREVGERCQRKELVLRDSEWAADRRVVAVTCGVEW
jgi:hypothetical protein